MLTKIRNFFLKRKFAVYRAKDFNSDGLACIASILHADRSSIFKPEIFKELYGSFTPIISLKQVIDILKDNGFIVRALTCKRQDLSQILTPAILHWKMNQFVLLIEVQNEKYRIHDPYFGTKWLSHLEVDQYFSNVVVEPKKDVII